MIEARTTGPEETKALAAALAGLTRPGDLYLLVGDLGAGKTAFTKGFGAALGVTCDITSPTFTLAHEYEGRLLVNHLDVYRIEALDEVRDLALPELLDGNAVTLIEWGDTIAAALPADFLEVRIEYGDEDDERLIHFRCVGNSWAARSADLSARLSEWLVEPC